MTKGHNKSKKKLSPLSGGGGGGGFKQRVSGVLSKERDKKLKKRGVGSDAATADDGVEDPALSAQRQRELAASKRKRGRLGTSLTGALGDPTEPTIKRKKLGG